MSKRLISAVAGFVHDIDHLASLSDGESNIRVLSDRTLYILQNLSGEDVTFLSRYGNILPNGYYSPVEDGTPNAQTVYDAVNLIRRDLNNMAIEDLLACICTSLQEISGSISAAQGVSCGCDIGSDVDTTDGQEGGPLPDPVAGVDYEAVSVIVNRKCKAANYIHNAIRDTVEELELKRADSYAFAGLGFSLTLVSTIVGGALIGGPFGLLVGAVVGGFLAMATLLFKASFSLSLLKTAITTDEAGAICALYEATSASQARADYEAVLLANGATSLEIEFVGHLLTNSVLNLLFFAWGDSEDAIDNVVVTHDCSSCFQGCVWQFLDTGLGPRGTGDLTDDGSQRTLSSVNHGGVDRIHIQIDTSGSCSEVNKDYIIKGSSQPTGWPTAQGWCTPVGGGYVLEWDHSNNGGPNPEIDVLWTGSRILLSRTDGPFTLSIVLNPGDSGPC